jgi:hypothetical protein
VLLACLRPQRPSVHVECRAPEEEDGYESLAGVFNRRKEMPSDRQQRRQTRSESVSRPHPLVIERRPEVLYVRYFGHSRSDSFDACGLAGETGGVLDVCFVLLGACQCLAHAVP